MKFYKPEPIAPDKSWIAKLLRWSAIVSTTGWACYGLFAFAFADLGVIPAVVQSWLVIIGSALIVIGAESNTVPTVIAALSKIGTDRYQNLDTAAFLASVVGTLGSVLITFSTRQVELAGTVWRELAITIGPLVMGVATVLDYYAASLELSLAKRDYERSMETWLEEKAQWDQAHGIAPERVQADPDWGTARIEDFRRVLGRLNGGSATLDADGLAEELARDELRLPSESTVKRWLKAARRG
jgi:hypothetical protein